MSEAKKKEWKKYVQALQKYNRKMVRYQEDVQKYAASLGEETEIDPPPPPENPPPPPNP